MKLCVERRIAYMLFHDKLSQYFSIHPCDEHKFYVYTLLCATLRVFAQRRLIASLVYKQLNI